MIAAVKSFGLVRGVAFVLLLAAPMYGYQHYLSWWYKPMSAEERANWDDEFSLSRYESTTPDMGGSKYGDDIFLRRACDSSTEGLISRWYAEPYSDRALLCIADSTAWHGHAWVQLSEVEP